MSDDWIILIPENPDGMPDPASQERARARFSEIAPEADEVEVRVENKIEFFHCGGNYERIVCPSCRSEIPNQWWQDTVDRTTTTVSSSPDTRRLAAARNTRSTN